MHTSEIRDQLQASLIDRYAIEREIGAGGMATVFLARDLKHRRPVALKLLRPDLGAVLGAERFLSEIQVTAGLQHPNLLPLFDSGEANGLLYYVMPFVEGESLRARLERERQLPVDEAIHIAATVAGALAYAHRQGVVHRDLKPENILLSEGQPLVADFGIALAVSNAGGARITQTGISLGTPQYMSPEQATGDRQLDGRSDIYSLAAVTYEMLTGEPPHTGSTVQAIIARVVTDRPRPVRATRESVPAHVEAALERALAKVPADRFQTAAEFADALQRPGVALPASIATPASASADLRGRPSPHARRRTLAVAAAVALAVALAGGAWMAAKYAWTAPAPVVRFSIGGAGEQVRGWWGHAVSPDGRTIVYLAEADGARRLVVRPLDRLEGRPLAGTEGAYHASFSPDGQWLVFATEDDRLAKVPVGGGPVLRLANHSRFTQAVWAEGDFIILDMRADGTLARIPAAGGEPRALTALDTAAGERWHRDPVLLADGRTVLFKVRKHVGPAGAPTDEFAVAAIGDGEGVVPHTRLGVEGDMGVGIVDGWLLYTAAGNGAMMAVQVDLERGRASGAPVVVLQDPNGGIGNVTLSANGTLLYGRRDALGVPVLVDSRGAATPLAGLAEHAARLEGMMWPRISPDGRRLAFMADSEGVAEIWIYDTRAHTLTRLTNGGAGAPEWMPDSRRVVFSRMSDGSRSTWSQPADGSEPARKVAEVDGFGRTLSPDGRTMVFDLATDGRSELWQVRLDGEGTARPLVVEAFSTSMPRLSPDGRWLAYVSNASNRNEVYVRPFPGPGPVVQVSQEGGTEPAWAPNGRQLYYRSGRSIVAASVVADRAFEVTARQPIFEDVFTGSMPHLNFDVMPDGKGFIMMASGASSQAVVVLNWLAELRAQLAERR